MNDPFTNNFINIVYIVSIHEYKLFSKCFKFILDLQGQYMFEIL